jgi:hypothetical protein
MEQSKRYDTSRKEKKKRGMGAYFGMKYCIKPPIAPTNIMTQ